MTDPEFAGIAIRAFLYTVEKIDATLAAWPGDQEPYTVIGYRARANRDRETCLAAATSWASR